MRQDRNKSWRMMLVEAMAAQHEQWSDVVACTLSDAELDECFDTGHGLEEGRPFTVWTAKRVYFPACYDGAEWVASVSRRPDGKPTPHVGG